MSDPAEPRPPGTILVKVPSSIEEIPRMSKDIQRLVDSLNQETPASLCRAQQLLSAALLCCRRLLERDRYLRAKLIRTHEEIDELRKEVEDLEMVMEYDLLERDKTPDEKKPIQILCYMDPKSPLPGLRGLAILDGHGIATHFSSTVDEVKHDMGVTSTWMHDVYALAAPEGFEIQWLGDPAESEEARKVFQSIKKNDDSSSGTI